MRKPDANGHIHEVSEAPHSPTGEASQGIYVATSGGNLVVYPNGSPLHDGDRYASEAEISTWEADHPPPKKPPVDEGKPTPIGEPSK